MSKQRQVSELDGRAMRLRAVPRSLGPVDRAISNNNAVSVQVREMGFSPGGATLPLCLLDQTRITFVAEGLTALAKETLGQPLKAAYARVLAANYRVVAGIRLAGGLNARPYVDINSHPDYDVRASFEILDLARMETQLGLQFPAIEKFFVLDVVQALPATAEALGSQLGAYYPMIVGRTYLPTDVFNAFYEAAQEFTDGNGDPVWTEDELVELEAIGRLFSQLDYNTPADVRSAIQLAERFSELCPFIRGVPMPAGFESVQSDKPGDTSDRQAGAQAARDRSEQIDQEGQGAGQGEDTDGEAEDGDAEGDDASDGDDGEQTAQRGSGSSDGETEGDDGDGTDGETSEAQSETQGQQAKDRAQRQNAAGIGNDSPERTPEETLQEQAEQLGNELSDELSDLALDIDMAVQEALEDARRLGEAEQVAPRAPTHGTMTPNDSARWARTQLVKALKGYYDEAAEDVQYSSRQGDVEVLDYVTGRRRFRNEMVPNRRQEITFDLMVAVDLSGSMESQVDQASQMLWAICGGLADIASFYPAGDELINWSAWGFDTNAYSLVPPHGRVERSSVDRWAHMGGTNPFSLLQDVVVPHFERSEYRHRALWMMTDGGWAGSGGAGVSESERQIVRLNQLGVHTVLIGLPENRSGAVAQYGRHHCQTGRDVQSPMQMIPLLKESISFMLHNALH